MSKRSLGALDGRSALARAIRDWRATVATDLGGEAELSRVERTLLDVGAQDVVLLTPVGRLQGDAAKVERSPIRDQLAQAEAEHDTLKAVVTAARVELERQARADGFMSDVA